MAKKEWKKIEDNIFRFEDVGDTIQGVLKQKEIGQVYGNEVYHIKTATDDFVIFSTVVLQSRMAGVDIGNEVKIVFTGTQPSKKKGQEDVKLFDVFVRETEN